MLLQRLVPPSIDTSCLRTPIAYLTYSICVLPFMAYPLWHMPCLVDRARHAHAPRQPIMKRDIVTHDLTLSDAS